MFQPITLFIALRYLHGKDKDRFGRFISWLSAIGITLGVMALIIVLSVMNGLEKEIQKNTLDYMSQAIITTPQGTLNKKQYPVTFFNDTLQGVSNIHSIITGDVILQSQSGIFVSRLIGIDPQQEDPAGESVLGLPFNQLEEGKYQVIIGNQLAKKLNLLLGDKVRLIVTQASQITPIGRIPSQRLFTVAGIYSVNPSVEYEQLYLHQQDAARLMRYPTDTITGWRLFLDAPLAIDKLIQQPLPDQLIFKDWREQKGDFFQAVSMEKNMMSLLISLIILVAAFNMITSLGLLVMEKQGEVAILQTQGLTRTKLMWVFIIQGASAGIIGTVIGSVIGICATLNLNTIRSTLGLSLQDIDFPVLILPHQIIMIVLFSILIALLSTIYPAWQAAKTQPAEALRYE